MYSTGLINHEGSVFAPSGIVEVEKSDVLDCGHSRPELKAGDFTVPWGIVHTAGGPQEYCADCCELLEVEAVKTLPAGAVYIGYFDLGKQQITTWRGTKLMRIYDYNIYRHNFGGRFVSISAIDQDGQWWHGRASYDWGQCINMHKCKGRAQ